MRKRAAMRLISGALAAVMAVSSLGILDALFGMRASAVEGSESISALAPDEYDNKTKTSDPVTLLVGDINHLGDGTTLEGVWRDYENTYLLGVAADFCIFLQGDLTVYDSDAEGRIAIGNDFYINVPWHSYAIGAGDYVTHYNLEELLPDMKGSAIIVLGGRIYNGQISDVYYEDGKHYEASGATGGGGIQSNTPTHKSYKKIAINDLNRTKDEILSWTFVDNEGKTQNAIPESSKGDYAKVSLSQTYVSKIIDFDYYYNTFLPQRSADLADEVADLKPTSPIYNDGYAKEEYEAFTVEYSNGTITFTYKHPEEATEVVHFKLSDEMFEYYRKAGNVNFVGIPYLPEARDVLTTEAETVKWEYSYIVVDVEADGRDNDNNRLYISDNGNGSATSKITTINEINISKIDDEHGENNDEGVTSLLYNFYNADEDTVIVLGANFQGTILAPKSHVTDCQILHSGGQGHLSGALIARSFEGYTEFGYRPFSGPAVMVGVSGYGIAVDKTDGDSSNSALLAGATISVYKAVEVEVDGKKYYVRGAEVASGVSSDEASLILGGLTEGKYILCETEAPDGYAITNKEIYFEITGEDINVPNITVGTGTTSPQAIVYTVVDGDPTSQYEITREEANDPTKYVAAEEGKYYEFGTGADQISQIFINTWNGIQITVNSVTIEYENGDIKKVDVNKTTTGYEPNNWINILTNSDFDNNNLPKTGIKKFTVNAKWVNPEWGQTSTEVQFGWQNGSWQTVYSINLQVGTEDTEIQIGDEIGPPTQYYKIASDGETSVVVNGQDVVATPGTEYAITKTFKAKKGTLTVYSDNTFTTKSGTVYYVNPLDIENNVYEIGGKKYTFKLDGDNFKLYDENNQEVTDQTILERIKLYHPDDAESWERVVIFDGNIIYPNDMIFNDGINQAFEIVNFKSKSSVTGEKVDAADTNNKLAGATFSVYEAVLSSDGTTTTYVKGDKVNTDTITSGADGSFVFADLPVGKYILCEDKAPEGYEKTDKEIYFEITSGEPSTREIILKTTYSYSPIIYTVGETSNEDEHVITRADANDEAKYVAAKEPKYYEFGEGSDKIGQIYIIPSNDVGVTVESVTIYYSTGSTKTYSRGNTYYGWTQFLHNSDVEAAFKTGISKITVNAKANETTTAKFGWQDGSSWSTVEEFEFTLTNEITEITLLDCAPTEYYKIVDEGEEPNVELDDGTIVEAEEIISYITRKFVVQNEVLTVYSDNTFTGEGKKYTANALDIENNVYEINGEKYTVELDESGGFKLYDENGEVTDESIIKALELLPVVGGGYVLIWNGEIVAPESKFGSVGEFTIKNYKTTDGPEEEKTAVKIEKVWEDYNNACGSRPDKITLTVTGTVDGVAKIEQTVELTKDNWSTAIYFSSKVTEVTEANGVYTFPMYHENGSKYNYTYTEAAVAGYEQDGEPEITDGKVTFKNKLNELGDLEVDKTWSDSDGFLGAIVHPEATFTLTALDGKISKELTLDSNGKLTFENLPLYTYSTDGNGNVTKTPIVYTLTETVTGYIGGTTDATPVDGKVNTWTFTLTDVTDFTEKVTKKIALQNNYEKTAIKITKVWVDNNAVDNRPDEIEVTVTGTANGKTVYTEKIEIKPDSAGDWKCMLSDLPKYYYYEDEADGTVKSVEIEYKVDETAVPGYTKKVEGDAENGFKITNTRTFGVPTDATTEYGWMLPLSMLLAIGTVFFAVRRAMQRALRPPKPYLRR